MDAVANNAEMVEYRVALIDSSSPMLLTVAGSGGSSLPRVRIPKWTRPAEEINDVIWREWQLHTLVLTILNEAGDKPPCAVAESLPSIAAKTSHDLAPNSIESLNETELDGEERAAIQSSIAGDTSPSAPFSRRGWLKEAQAWVQSSISDRRIEFSGDLRQYNASSTFALVRLDTTCGDSYWLKATGEPNKHECALTVELSKLFPQYLPSLIAVREDWNAWVTKGAGRPLGDLRDLNLLTSAVKALADVQVESLNSVERLELAGCMDRRLTRVQSHLPEMFAFLEEAMEKQTSTKVKPLTPARLREIQVVVDQSCAQMQELGIPDCLVNGDVNLDNILYDGEHFRFVDWAEGGIGNPFLALQQVIQHVIREGEHLDWVTPICAAYKNEWRGLLTERQIDDAFVLMPLLAMADYLYGRGDWLDAPRRHEPAFQSFARTLGRCIDRAVAELSSAEVLQI
jgi:hypothetical protein